MTPDDDECALMDIVGSAIIADAEVMAFRSLLGRGISEADARAVIDNPLFQFGISSALLAAHRALRGGMYPGFRQI